MEDKKNIRLKWDYVDINKLIPYVNNARKHTKQNIGLIQSSLRRYGFVNPIGIDSKYNIIYGHGRWEAAKLEGYTEVPVTIVDHLSELERQAYVLADNQIALKSEWDEEMLANEVKQIMEEMSKQNITDLVTGFDEKEINKILNSVGEVQEDNFDVDAELQKPAFSKLGDVWKLGKHVVICGSSTEEATFKNLLGDMKVNLVCTDPPYLVKYENKSGKIKNDDLNDKEGYEFLLKAFTNLKNAMSIDASVYVFYATMKSRVFHDAFEDAGLRVGAGLVWKKERITMTRTDWKYIHEPIIWGWRKDGKHIWYGDQSQATVFEFARIKDSKEEGCGHPTSKPVPLIAYLIKQCTQTNGIVLDGFLGSASTLIACEQLGRVCYGVELDPKFVDVAVERYKKLMSSTEQIKLIRDGKELKYEEVKKDE